MIVSPASVSSTFVVGNESGFHTRHSAAIINGGQRATIRFHNGLKAYADIFAQDDDDQNEDNYRTTFAITDDMDEDAESLEDIVADE